MWTAIAIANLSGGELQEAFALRDRLAAKMTPRQIGEAQQLARDWRPVDVAASSRILLAQVGPPGGGPRVPLPKPDVEPICAKVEPAYTEDGRRSQVQGTVTLDAAVNVDGRVYLIALVHGLGFGLDEEAEKAIGKLKCTPGKKDGKPVPSEMRFVIDFRLK